MLARTADRVPDARRNPSPTRPIRGGVRLMPDTRSAKRFPIATTPPYQRPGCDVDDEHELVVVGGSQLIRRSCVGKSRRHGSIPVHDLGQKLVASSPTTFGVVVECFESDRVHRRALAFGRPVGSGHLGSVWSGEAPGAVGFSVDGEPDLFPSVVFAAERCPVSGVGHTAGGVFVDVVDLTCAGA